MAAAAYRSGEKLVNEWDGLTLDYTRNSSKIKSKKMYKGVGKREKMCGEAQKSEIAF